MNPKKLDDDTVQWAWPGKAREGEENEMRWTNYNVCAINLNTNKQVGKAERD